MRTEKEQIERLKILTAKYDFIDITKHQQDFCICQEYLAGNKETFQNMLENALKKTKKYVFYSTGRLFNDQDREDIISETLEIAISRIDTFRGWSRYSTWMRGIAKNRIYSFVKIKTKENNLLVHQNESEDDENFQRKVDKQISVPVQKFSVFEMLNSLSQEYRLVVKYHVIEKWTFAEIAAELKISQKKVSKYYDKAMKQLRQEMYDSI
jgi:RNA polymerase sigma factor (sigma-70 family)